MRLHNTVTSYIGQWLTTADKQKCYSHDLASFPGNLQVAMDSSSCTKPLLFCAVARIASDSLLMHKVLSSGLTNGQQALALTTQYRYFTLDSLNPGTFCRWCSCKFPVPLRYKGFESQLPFVVDLSDGDSMARL